MATTRFFFQASQEHFPPEDLLAQAVEAEQLGFDGIASSDHLQPWWEGGQSGHTWPWLGAAGQATSTILLGTGVTPPGARYHPGLIAQAWATLERLFPGRMFLGIGSGEALNEVPVGDPWPAPSEQVARMDEALDIIDRLWRGETLTQEGHFTCKDLKLHTLPERRPPVWVSAFGPEAAKVAARRGDGFWTLADPERVPELLDVYRAECEAAGKRTGEIVLHAGFSWAPDEQQALEAVRKWKGAQPDDVYRDDIHIPANVYAHGEETTSDEDMKAGFIVGADPAEHAERIREIEKLGATIVVLQNNSGADPHGAIRVYGERVLPQLRGARVA
jgi:coenzyme F420-dependent glucose-6-phosphate dehydrogenase